VKRESRHVFWPSLLWLQVGLREPDRIGRDLAALDRKGIDVVRGETEAIDPERKSVVVEGVEMAADHVVISLGARLAPERVPGLAEAGHNLFTLEGATAIRDARKQLDQGRLGVLTAGVPYKCSAAPYEAALLLDHALRMRKLRDRVEVAVYAWEPAPMGVAGPEISGTVRDLLEARGIPYHPGHQVTSVDGATGTLHFGNGAEAHFDLLVYVPPHVAPDVVKRAGLLGESGWAPVDRHTMQTGSQGVYAIGDVTGIPLAIGMPLPKAGVFAHHQAEAVAQTIASEIAGKGNGGRYEGAGECFIEIGGGKAGFGRGNFYAEPSPMVKLHRPTRYWHAAKAVFEKDWFRRWL
jgi:sulfide:quinone oxidoreductase